MNPVVHAELSWLVGARLSFRRDRLLLTVAGVAPDLDGLTLLAGEEAYAAWHHVLTHGLVSVALCAAVLAAMARQKTLVGVLGFLAFHLHLGCDLMGSGPGWPITSLWPFSHHETMWDGQWSLASWQNTVVGLAATLGVLACAVPLGSTAVALLSTKAALAVVAEVRARFGPRP